MIIDLQVIPKDSSESEDEFLIWEQRGDEGDPDAQYELAKCYRDGNHVKKSYLQAFYYFKLAADQGHPQAQTSTAFCYEYGDGVKQSNERAFHYYKLAADQGHIGAQSCLGKFYAEGKGILKSYEKAFHYYKLAADKGNIIALEYLAEAYEKGLGVECSAERAAFYLQQKINHLKSKSAAGNPNAQFILGTYFEKGLSVDQDLRQAISYYQLAAKNGHLLAKKRLEPFDLLVTLSDNDMEKAINDLIDDYENGIRTTTPDSESNMHFYQRLEKYMEVEDALLNKLYKPTYVFRGVFKRLIKFLCGCLNLKK